MGPDKRGLVVLATQIAEQLVATALEALMSDAAAAGGVSIGGRTVAVTLADVPPPIRRQLGPAPTERKKPGPKPGKRKYTRRTKPAAAVVAESARPAAAPAGDVDLALRRCRKCKQIGTAQPVPGSDRQVKCTKCRFVWKIRRQGNERGAAPAPPKPRRVNAASTPNTCRRCDHDIDNHELSQGRCLIPRCACTELYL